MAKRKLPYSAPGLEPESKRLKHSTSITRDNCADEARGSVLIPERITRSQSRTISFYLKRCGLLAKSNRYSKALSVFNRGMKKFSSVFKCDELYDFLFFLLWDALEEGRRFVFAQTLLLIVRGIEQNQAVNQNNHSKELAPFCCLLIPNAFIAVRNAGEHKRLKILVKRLVKVFPELDNSYSLLHHLISALLGVEVHFVKHHISGILELLMDCEVNMNAVDFEGNTPLHDVARCNGHMDTEGACSMAEMLLANGAHIDCPNSRGQTALDVAIPAVKAVLRQRYPLSLQCLAASAVVHHCVPYLHRLPTAVQNFIKLHTPGQAR